MKPFGSVSANPCAIVALWTPQRTALIQVELSHELMGNAVSNSVGVSPSA